MLERNDLGEVALRYRAGFRNWQKPHYCGDLDNWIDENWDAIEPVCNYLRESS